MGVTMLGHARIVEDPARIGAIRIAMDAKYHGDDAEESVTDVPEDVEWALIEIVVASASVQDY